MMYYIVYIFQVSVLRFQDLMKANPPQMAGLTGNSTLLSASIQYIINVVMTLPALIFIDRLPRRKLFIFGALGMGVFQFTQAGLMATYGHAVPGGLKGSPTVTWKVTNAKASKAIIACSYLFIATYAPTWGPLGWYVFRLAPTINLRFIDCFCRAYPPEIIPLYIRSKAVSLATFFNWGCNFALTFFTPPGFKNIQWKVSLSFQFLLEMSDPEQIYCVFGTLCIVAAIHVFFLFQETVGKSLEEVDEIFEKQSVWAFKARQEPSRLAADIEQAKEDINQGKISMSRVQAPKR